MHDLCGEYGVCSTTTKGAFRMSSCSCFGGYKGWSCEVNSMVDEVIMLADFIIRVHTISYHLCCLFSELSSGQNFVPNLEQLLLSTCHYLCCVL